MDLPDSVVDAIPAFVARRYFQVSFSIPTAFIDIFAEPVADNTATTDHDYSPDSTNDEFVSGEEHITSCLVSFRAKVATWNPDTRLQITRHRTRVYFYGFAPSFTTLRSLASVSFTWLQAVYKEISKEHFVIFNDLERASQEGELPYRILCSTHDAYVARYTGRVVRNLFWGRVNVPAIRSP